MNKAAGSSGAAPTGERLAAGRKVGVLRGGRWLIRNVDISIHRGEIVTLIGPNGSGKSTSVKMALGIMAPNEGTATRSKGLRVGYVPQKLAIDWTLPLTVSRFMSLTGPVEGADADAALTETGIAHLAGSELRNLSGGEFQRAMLARAILRKPDLLVLDEPVSALDVSTQSQVINLLEDLQKETGAAYLFIAHDLAVVRHISTRIAVMYHSRIVETGTADDVCERPTHPYTELLLASIPDPDPEVQREKSDRRRELTRGVAGASGRAPTNSCPFAERCPHVMDVCHQSFPEFVPTQTGGTVACHLHTSGPKLNGAPIASIKTPAT